MTVLGSTAANSILTATGSGSNVFGNSNLTFNGSTLSVTGNITTTSTLSNSIGGVVLSNSQLGVNCNAPAYTLDVFGTARTVGSTYLAAGGSIVDNFSNSSVPTTGTPWTYAPPLGSLVHNSWVWTQGGITYGATTWNAAQNPITPIPYSLGYNAFVQAAGGTNPSTLTRATLVASGQSCTLSFWWTHRGPYTTFTVTVAYGSQTLATFTSFASQNPWTFATYTFTTSAANQNIVFTATAPNGTDQSFDIAYFQFIPSTNVGINTTSPAAGYSLDVSGNANVSGIMTVQETQEVVVAAASPGTAYTANWANGDIFYMTSLAGNMTVNITNLPTTANRNYTLVFWLVQGGTGYYINVLQVAGVGVTIRFATNTAPVPTANVVGVQTFMLYYSGSAWTAVSTFTNFA